MLSFSFVIYSIAPPTFLKISLFYLFLLLLPFLPLIPLSAFFGTLLVPDYFLLIYIHKYNISLKPSHCSILSQLQLLTGPTLYTYWGIVGVFSVDFQKDSCIHKLPYMCKFYCYIIEMKFLVMGDSRHNWLKPWWFKPILVLLHTISRFGGSRPNTLHLLGYMIC